MTILSSKKDYFLDSISNLEENLQISYLKKIEKYILNDVEEKSEVIKFFKRQDMINNSKTFSKRGSIFSDTKFQKIHEFEQGNSHYEFDEGDIKNVLKELNKKIKDLENKNQEYLVEIYALKKANSKKLKDQENILSESILQNNLQNQIHLKENEIIENKKEHELLMKRYVDENYRLKESVDIFEEKLVEYTDIKNENEKLKKKAKELEILKEKMSSHEKSVLDLQNKNSQIDILTKEKQNYIQSVDKLQKDIISEKDKSRLSETEKKKLENELIDSKRESIKLQRKYEHNSNSDISNLNIENINSNTNLNNLKNNYLELMKKQSLSNGDVMLEYKNLDLDIVILEISKSNEKIKILEKEVI